MKICPVLKMLMWMESCLNGCYHLDARINSVQVCMMTSMQQKAVHSSALQGCGAEAQQSRSRMLLLLGRPCKIGSVVFVRDSQPPRLHLKTSRERVPLVLPLCGHGDLEIVSVKELADGFLHFSFGALPNASTPSKVDELSSSSGEHLAGKLAAPCRLPSQFLKKSPIPIAAVRRRKWQMENLSKERATEATSASIKDSVKLLSRPKSCFIKRSPIPTRTSVQSLQKLISANQSGEVHNKGKGVSVPQRTKEEVLKQVETFKRLPSKFVRKSPVPSSATRHHVRSLPLPAELDFTSDRATDSAVKLPGKPRAAQASRPKSYFLRKSPIIKVHQRTPQEVSTIDDSHKKPPSYKVSNKVDVGLVKEESGSLMMAERQSEPPLHTADLHKYKLAELKSFAKSKGVKGYSKLKKGELLDLLKNLKS